MNAEWPHNTLIFSRGWNDYLFVSSAFSPPPPSVVNFLLEVGTNLIKRQHADRANPMGCRRLLPLAFLGRRAFRRRRAGV